LIKNKTMKTSITEKIIIMMLMLGSLLAIYFGSYLPFMKAQKYIFLSNSIRNIKTFEQFKEMSQSLFDFRSPIGQEEAVRFFSREVLTMIRNPDQPEQVSRELAKLLEPYYFRNNVRHLSNMGEIYALLWGKYKTEEDFAQAEFYFLKVLEIGPDLPPPLYTLFELYKLHGDTQKMKEIGERIVTNWPEDAGVRQLIQSIK